MLFQRLDDDLVVAQVHLCRLLADRPAEILAGPVRAGDREQLRLHAVAEDPRARVALGAGQGPAAQRAVDMDVADRHDLGARADRAEDDEVGFGEDALAGAHVLADDARGRPRRVRRLRRLVLAPRLVRAQVAAAAQHDQARRGRLALLLGGRVLDARERQLARAHLQDEQAEIDRAVRHVPEIEHERDIGEEVRRLLQPRVERRVERRVDPAVELQHDGCEEAAADLERRRGRRCFCCRADTRHAGTLQMSSPLRVRLFSCLSKDRGEVQRSN
jgi:hypothetical protein